MFKKNLLKNICSRGFQKRRISVLQSFIDWLTMPRILRIRIPFLKSTYEKIAILREEYARRYKEEEKTQMVSVPYFLRASKKIDEIIQNNQVDFEYKKYCRKKAEEER